MFLSNCKFRETAGAADVRCFIEELCDGLCNLLMVLLSEVRVRYLESGGAIM